LGAVKLIEGTKSKIRDEEATGQKNAGKPGKEKKVAEAEQATAPLAM
jgi:hypothetical protein